MTTTTILQTVSDKKLFAPWFRNGSWSAWFAFLAALFALPMTSEQVEVYRACTGRTAPPSSPAIEAWLICGRRAGKSFILALVAVFLACFHVYDKHLARGERGTVLVIAVDRKQARTIFRYISALLRDVPMLAAMIERETAEGFDLSNGVTIEIATASFRSVRGYAIVAALVDEIAFLPTDTSAEPDTELIAALRPGMATIPGAKLLCASSPYARRGSLFDAHKKHFAQDGDPILVWQAPTRTMNPSISQAMVDAAMEADAASALAEWMAQFRIDIETAFAREIVEAAVDPGVFERAPIDGVRGFAYCDPAGGSGADSMTLAVSHAENRVLTLDALREVRPPFSPEATVAEFADLLKRYRISTVTGDRYAGSWPAEQFSKCGITYRVGERVCSDIYRDILPELNSKNVALLDNARLISQLCRLERRTSRGGRDVISHPPNQHDDIANAVCGALLLAKPKAAYMPQGSPDIGVAQVDRGGSGFGSEVYGNMPEGSGDGGSPELW
jgi:hypothetical protein